MTTNYKILHFLILSLFSFLVCGCATKDTTEGTDEEKAANSSATIVMDGFYPGDAVTRSSLSYGYGGLKFSWQLGDLFGIFPTSHINGDGTREDNSHATQEPFTLTEVSNDGLSARITSQRSWFKFLPDYRYSAYTQYQNGNVEYNRIPFDFSNQTQHGYVNMGAYYTGGGYNNADYKASEALACQHLGALDVLMSPETVTHQDVLTFYMRHVGAVARCFIKTPPGKRLRIREVKLVASTKIFYERGYINLTSHPYDDTKVPSTTEPANASQVNNWGAALPQADGSQLTHDPESATDCLTLKFDDGNVNERHKGVWNLAAQDATYGGYLLAYIMMYPINYDQTTTNAYLYVIADDVDGNELHYRTTKLVGKYMCSGYVYQWTKTPNDIYPIELTATTQTWQEVAAGAIETDLEK